MCARVGRGEGDARRIARTLRENWFETVAQVAALSPEQLIAMDVPARFAQEMRLVLAEEAEAASEASEAASEASEAASEASSDASTRAGDGPAYFFGSVLPAAAWTCAAWPARGGGLDVSMNVPRRLAARVPREMREVVRLLSDGNVPARGAG